MDNRYSERDLNIKLLLAENKKLKHLLNRLNGFDGSASLASSTDGYLPYHLPLKVSQILSAGFTFNEKIQSVIDYLGDYTSSSRVYVFEDSEDNSECSNTYEWCNEEVSPQKSHLQNVKYSDVPSWKQLLNDKGHIISSNIENELPSDIVALLKPQSIKSILVYPLTTGEQVFGFVGLDECSFYRQWTELEKALLATGARLISNAYQQNISVRQIRNSLQIQQFLFDIASIINQSESLDDPLQPVAHKITDTWQLEGFGLYFRDKDQPNRYRLEGSSFTGDPGFSFPAEVGIKESFPIIVLPDNKAYEKCRAADQTGIRQALGFPRHNCLMAGIKTHNGPNGLLVVKWNDSLTEPPLRYTILETTAGMLARHFDHRHAEEKNKRHHEQILKINEQLEEKESFLNNIILAAPVGIMLVKDRVIQYVNDQVSESVQFSRQELIGRHFSELYADNSENLDDIQRFYHEIQNKGLSTIDVHLKKKNGDSLYYQVIGTPGPGYDEKGLYLLIGQDMTQIKAVEDSLIESEERNRCIIEANIDGIFIMSEPGRLVYVNNAGCDLTGYSRTELSGLNLSGLFPDKNGIRDYLKIINQIRQGFDYRGDSKLRHKNGSWLYVELHGTMIALEGVSHFYFSIHDITKRKQNEADLRLSEKKFRSLSENLPDCIIRIDNTGLVTYWNSVFFELHGLDRGVLKQNNVFKIDDLPGVFSEYFIPALNYVLKNKKIVQLEMELPRQDETLTFDWSLSPELDDAGECLSVLGIGRDITPRKKVEKELLLAKEEAEAADRLKSAFLANMSHEIRTPLNAIVGFTNLLGQTDPECAEREEYISLINNSADSLMSLITDIVDIAKMESGYFDIHCKAVDVDKSMQSVYHIYRKRIDHQFRGRVELRYSAPASNGRAVYIDADAARLIQVLNNLLDNAIKFIHHGFIELGYSIEKQRVRFFVRDTGIGIAPENQKFVFDAFRQVEVSNSKKYGGTGLGLAISKKLAEAMNGQIGLVSELNQGTEFFIYLNLHPDMFSGKLPQLYDIGNDTPLQLNIPNWSDRLLLIVNENSGVHMQMKKHLEKTKITILLARSGAAARKILNTRDDVSAVIMDNVLPDVDVKDLVQQLRSQNINTPILIQGEGIRPENLEGFFRVGIDGCLSDPIQDTELIRRIHHFLDTVNIL